MPVGPAVPVFTRYSRRVVADRDLGLVNGGPARTLKAHRDEARVRRSSRLKASTSRLGPQREVCVVLSQVALQVLQSAVVLGLAPLYSGAMARAEAVVASKRGPSVWQPYRGPPQAAAQGQHNQRPGILGLPGGAVRRGRLLPGHDQPPTPHTPSSLIH